MTFGANCEYEPIRVQVLCLCHVLLRLVGCVSVKPMACNGVVFLLSGNELM